MTSPDTNQSREEAGPMTERMTQGTALLALALTGCSIQGDSICTRKADGASFSAYSVTDVHTLQVSYYHFSTRRSAIGIADHIAVLPASPHWTCHKKEQNT